VLLNGQIVCRNTTARRSGMPALGPDQWSQAGRVKWATPMRAQMAWPITIAARLSAHQYLTCPAGLSVCSGVEYSATETSDQIQIPVSAGLLFYNAIGRTQGKYHVARFTPRSPFLTEGSAVRQTTELRGRRSPWELSTVGIPTNGVSDEWARQRRAFPCERADAVRAPTLPELYGPQARISPRPPTTRVTKIRSRASPPAIQRDAPRALPLRGGDSRLQPGHLCFQLRNRQTFAATAAGGNPDLGSESPERTPRVLSCSLTG